MRVFVRAHGTDVQHLSYRKGMPTCMYPAFVIVNFNNHNGYILLTYSTPLCADGHLSFYPCIHLSLHAFILTNIIYIYIYIKDYTKSNKLLLDKVSTMPFSNMVVMSPILMIHFHNTDNRDNILL